MPRNARADAGMPAALTCADVRASEWDFVEGALPLPERLAVQAHLDGCESCRHAVALCRTAEGALLSAVTQIPPAGDLRAGFYARLAAEQRPTRRYGRPLALSALAAGALLLAVLGPALKSPFATHPVSTSASGTVAQDSHRPPAGAIAGNTASLAFGDEAVLPAIRSVPGFSEAQADKLFAAVDAKYIKPVHTRRVRSRSASRPHVQHPWLSDLPTLASADRPASLGYMYGTDRAKTSSEAESRDRALSLKENLGKETFTVPNGIVSGDTTFGRVVVVTAMPPAAGVSLEVTDQVRGFSNTTRVASDVEVEGGSSTIQLRADDN